jgi:hypothetical protein
MGDRRTINPVGQEQRTERSEVSRETFKSLQKTGTREFALAEYGYKPDGRPVPIEYLARVTSIRNAATVIAPLQEDILLRVESRWEPLVPTSLLATGNILLQAATKGRKSLVTKATSRRIWSGTSPMTLSLRMHFEATENPFTEVAEPCRLLQSIALPSEPREGKTNRSEISKHQTIQDVSGALSKIPILGPPGPTPFTTEGILNLQRPSNELGDTTSIVEGLKGGDKIMVELGRFVTFFNVIVREVSATVPIKFDPLGNPVSATVNMVFETYEMMTVEGLSDAYRKTAASTNDTGGGQAL